MRSRQACAITRPAPRFIVQHRGAVHVLQANRTRTIRSLRLDLPSLRTRRCPPPRPESSPDRSSHEFGHPPADLVADLNAGIYAEPGINGALLRNQVRAELDGTRVTGNRAG